MNQEKRPADRPPRRRPDDADGKKSDDENQQRPRLRGPNPWLLMIALGMLVGLFLLSRGAQRSLIDYDLFREYVSLGKVESVQFASITCPVSCGTVTPA